MLRYVGVPKGLLGQEEEEVLAVSTEDGRVLFYAATAQEVDNPVLLGTLGGRSLGMPGRVKDFSVASQGGKLFVVTAGSDGVVRVFDLCGEGSGIEIGEDEMEVTKKTKVEEKKKEEGDRQVGRLVGVYETARRITCMATMIMEEGAEGEAEDEEMAEASEEETESSDEESE
jgi:protein MAK11